MNIIISHPTTSELYFNSIFASWFFIVFCLLNQYTFLIWIKYLSDFKIVDQSITTISSKSFENGVSWYDQYIFYLLMLEQYYMYIQTWFLCMRLAKIFFHVYSSNASGYWGRCKGKRLCVTQMIFLGFRFPLSFETIVYVH